MAATELTSEMDFLKDVTNNESADSINIELTGMTVEDKAPSNNDASEDNEIIEVTYLHDNFSQHLSIPLTEDEDKLSRLLAERGIKANKGVSRHTYISEKFPPMKNQLQDLDHYGQNSLISHALVTYISTIDPHVFKRFGERVFSDVCHWTQQVIQAPGTSLYLHDDHINGLVSVARLSLLRKFPKFPDDGFRALLSRPPVIYVGPATKSGVTHFLCNQLGLPISSIREVDCMTSEPQLMDPVALRRIVDEDVGNGLTPILLLAFAGTHMMGKIDDLQAIQKICQERDMWMHCEGSSLSLLVQESIPESLRPALTCDSLTLNLSLWLGVPGIPFITIFKEQTPELAHISGLYVPGTVFFKRCVPLWCCFQGLGINELRNRCFEPMTLLKSMYQKLKDFDHLNIVNTLKEDSVTILFRYEYINDITNGSKTIDIKDPYFDSLNIWLVDILRRDISAILAHSIRIDGIGFCIRYSPLEHSNIKGTTLEDIAMWIDHFKIQIRILDATVNQKLEFEEIVKAQDSLRLLKIPSWAGLGAIQYVPPVYLEKYDSLTDDEKTELNDINMKLVELLKDSDAAFSLGETEAGEICARFGLITAETDFEELIGLVYAKGKQVEESFKFLETMADVIREGIEKAESDLVCEEQMRLANEGLMRQIPGVGSFVNWFSPPLKDPKKGRTFDLSSGLIESTQKTYEMKMQVQHASHSISETSTNMPESFKSVLKRCPSKEEKPQLNSQESISDSVFEKTKQ